jgi:cell division protein ZapA (FtsZ GTPase activity inhibitor)
VYSVEQLLTIELFGQAYAFKADEDFDRAKQVADLIVKEVERVEMEQVVPSSGMRKVAVLLLATLNIANENYELKKKQASVYRTVGTRLKNLLNLLEGHASVPE